MHFSRSSFVRSIKAAAAVALAATVCAAVPAAASADPPVALSGAFVGWGASSVLSSFGSWRGASDTVVGDYLNYDDWSSVADPSALLSDWAGFHAAGGQLVLSVPLLVSDTPGTFAAGAAGAYDQYFLSMGRQLVAGGFSSAVLRLGWEFNGTWFPWSVQPNSATMGTAAFVAYWQHVVDLLRSIPGSHFKFDWTVNLGQGDINPAAAYPGSAYVDYVGMDVYDRGWSATGGPIADPVARWQQLSGQTQGMNYWSSFAAQNGKQVAIGEWGLFNDVSQNGGGDDPYFIQQMYNWMQSNNVAYEIYFNADNSVMNSTTEPQSAAEYQALWGDSAGTTTTSAPATVSPAPVSAVSSPAPVSAVSSPAPVSAVSSPAPVSAASSPAPVISTPSAPVSATSSTAPAPTKKQTEPAKAKAKPVAKKAKPAAKKAKPAKAAPHSAKTRIAAEPRHKPNRGKRLGAPVKTASSSRR